MAGKDDSDSTIISPIRAILIKATVANTEGDTQKAVKYLIEAVDTMAHKKTT